MPAASRVGQAPLEDQPVARAESLEIGRCAMRCLGIEIDRLAASPRLARLVMDDPPVGLLVENRGSRHVVAALTKDLISKMPGVDPLRKAVATPHVRRPDVSKSDRCDVSILGFGVPRMDLLANPLLEGSAVAWP